MRTLLLSPVRPLQFGDRHVKRYFLANLDDFLALKALEGDDVFDVQKNEHVNFKATPAGIKLLTKQGILFEEKKNVEAYLKDKDVESLKNLGPQEILRRLAKYSI